jgi:hypothetical protein
MRRATVVVLAAVGCVSILAGCHRARSSAQVDEDVAAARERAARQTEKVEESAQTKLADARKEVRSAERDAEHVDAVEAQKVADTQAEGTRKVALAACEALSGDAQVSCKDKAEADYQAAEARAKQERAATDPKP